MARESKAPQSPGSSEWLAMVITAAVTLGAAMLLVHWNENYLAAFAPLLVYSSVAEETHAG